MKQNGTPNDGNTFIRRYSKKENYWITIFGIASLLFLVLRFVLELTNIDALERYQTRAKELSIIAVLIFIILLVGKMIEKAVVLKSHSEGSRYNLIRITRLLTIIFIILAILSFLSHNYNITLFSLGLASLILGFALQTPISNFIGWIYIVFRSPFKVGDRIQVGNLRGDVIKIDYLDTLMLEFGGDYLSNDRISGRVISFPNSHVFRTEIFNYNGPYLPFILNETAVQIAFTSDLEFVTKCLTDAAEEDFRWRYTEVKVEEMLPQWETRVYFRVNQYAWLEAVVSYPVKPKETTLRRSGILKIALEKLNNEPDRVQFPKGTMR